MSVHDELGFRMKNNYEIPARSYLTRRMPVIIRIDGRAFHTFTKGMNKPYDYIFASAMQKTAHYLCKNIQNCVFGYTQSDEISLLLNDFQSLDTSAWFDNQVQKMISIAAAMATSAFIKFFTIQVNKIQDESEYKRMLLKKIEKLVQFDARAFNIPKEEVNNYFYWRQLDAVRNSIQSLGHALFSTKEIKGKSNNEVQDILYQKYGINWDDVDPLFKMGTAIYRSVEETKENYSVYWIIDSDLPRFNIDHDFVEQWITDDLSARFIFIEKFKIKHEDELITRTPEHRETMLKIKNAVNAYKRGKESNRRSYVSREAD